MMLTVYINLQAVMWVKSTAHTTIYEVGWGTEN